MPPLSALGSATFDPVAAVLLAVGALLYAAGVVRVRVSGGRWPTRSTLAFAVLGLGSYAALTARHLEQRGG